MEIRRAILLFAIVLGLAALVTSFTRQADEDTGSEPAPAAQERRDARPAPPTESAAPATLRFPAGAEATTRTLAPGRAATLVVDVLAPGEVAVGSLGLSSSTVPGTPIRFDVLPGEPGRHRITFTPANGADGRTIGVLRVRD